MVITIIGISGVSGAGKTTLAKELSTSLKATSLFWDDFDSISTSPDDYVTWHASGQGNEAWDYPALAAVLDVLKKGQPIKHPVLHHLLKPTKYIIFDAPMGRLHKQTGTYIDFWIHIDTPLDVALARRTIRDLERDLQSVSDLIKNLKYYLDHSRDLFFADEEKQKADLIVDGVLSVEEQINKIRKFLFTKIE
ncbi:MAG: uridine kinase [Candidatus Paracaedibacter sp.]